MRHLLRACRPRCCVRPRAITSGFSVIIDALSSAAQRTRFTIALACAAAGIVIGVVLLSGLAIEFTAFIVRLSQETLVLALILTAMAGIMLGMGLPTTPPYIIQVALLVPALVKLGVQIEAAHLFVFYYSCLSTITPPVASRCSPRRESPAAVSGRPDGPR